MIVVVMPVGIPNEGPRALTVSDSLMDNCEAETRIDHQVDDDDKRVSPNSIRMIDGLDSSNSSDGGSSESSQGNNKSRKRSRSPSVDRRSNFKRRTSRRDDNNRDTSSRYGNSLGTIVATMESSVIARPIKIVQIIQITGIRIKIETSFEIILITTTDHTITIECLTQRVVPQA